MTTKTQPAAQYRFVPRRVEKPWGHELIWALTDSYCGKLLFVEAGHALSLQLHERKDETIHLQSGSVELEVGESRDELALELVEEGASFRLRPGTVHRLRALTDAVVLEVSTPHLDDVVRLEDVYGRTEPTDISAGDLFEK